MGGKFIGKRQVPVCFRIAGPADVLDARPKLKAKSAREQQELKNQIIGDLNFILTESSLELIEDIYGYARDKFVEERGKVNLKNRAE